jgi:hypothetical protein
MRKKINKFALTLYIICNKMRITCLFKNEEKNGSIFYASENNFTDSVFSVDTIIVLVSYLLI